MRMQYSVILGWSVPLNGVHWPLKGVHSHGHGAFLGLSMLHLLAFFLLLLLSSLLFLLLLLGFLAFFKSSAPLRCRHLR